MANVLGWLAYTIYDDVLDEDSDPAFLSVANIALRELTIKYERAAQERMGAKGRVIFLKLFREVMDGIDHANYWERRTCRLQADERKQHTHADEDQAPGQDKSAFAMPDSLPDFGGLSVLAEKSLGHALSPIALMIMNGQAADGPDTKSMIKFFRHYLIARQLNDDAHDWLPDLEKGFVNSVAAQMLIPFRKDKRPRHIPVAELQRAFWNSTIDTACEDITRHVAMAKDAIAACKSIRNPEYFMSLLAPIQKSADTALAERDSTREFLSSY